MAKRKFQPKGITDFSGGYRFEKSAPEGQKTFIVDGQNMDVFATSDGYGLTRMNGNVELLQIEGERVVGIHEYINGTDKYLLAHTVNDTEGKVYLYNGTTVRLIKDGLDKDAVHSTGYNFTQTIPKRYLFIFNNGVDAKFSFELGAETEVQNIDTTDLTGETLRGLPCLAWDASAWMVHKNRLAKSKQLDPFTWNEANDSYYKDFDGDIINITTFSNGLLIATTNGLWHCTKASAGYNFDTINPSEVVSAFAIAKHDDYALFFSKDGIYPVISSTENVKKVNTKITPYIQNIFDDLDINRLDEVYAHSVTTNGRNEVWFHFPSVSQPDNSVFWIFRWREKNKYWLKRVQQKVNCIGTYNGYLVTGTDDGKVLAEMSESNKLFDNENIDAWASLSDISYGLEHQEQKIKKLYGILDNLIDNKFIIRYAYNKNNSSPHDKEISKIYTADLIWGDDEETIGGEWADDEETMGMSWAEDIPVKFTMPKPKKHDSIRITILCNQPDHDVALTRLETGIIKVDSK